MRSDTHPDDSVERGVLYTRANKRKLPTDQFRILRLVERFPFWVRSFDGFFQLGEEWQAKLLTYEHLRECEEAEAVAISSGLGLKQA